jgi:hypothetical protein
MNITKKKPQTMRAVMRRASGFRAPTHRSQERQFEAYAKFCDFYEKLRVNVTQVGAKHLGVTLNFPSPPVLGAQFAGRSYEKTQAAIEQSVDDAADRFREECVRNGLGVVTPGEDGDSYTFLYHDVHQRKGLFRHVITRRPHESVVVHGRVRRLDDRDVTLPPGGQAIVDALLPELRPELRVVVGAQVATATGADEVRNELTPFGRKLLTGGKVAAKAGAVAAVGAAAVAAIGLLGAAGVGAGMALATVFVADPALILGDLVFFGWEE